MAGRRDGAFTTLKRGRSKKQWYPAHWEADIALRDGSAAFLRPMRPSDAPALQAMHAAQSEHSRYMRFLAPMPTLSDKDLAFFTTVDHSDRVAFAVFQGEAMVASGRYDRLNDTDAEVAFYVADSHQGLGIGSILLEHLAAAGRERGISRFTAEVHPSNSAMIRVFTDAGYDVKRTLDDGVILVEFSIHPTQRSVEVIAEREHRAEARAMERLLNPESILIVGISTRVETAGAHMVRALDRSGWNGTIHVVARDLFEYRGHQVYGRISDVPGPVDLAVLAVGPSKLPEAIRECASLGVKGLLVPSEVYTGDETDGDDLQRQVIATARRHGMRVLGPGSFGFLRSGENPIALTPTSKILPAGPVAIAAQSGAMAAQFLAAADERGTGLYEMVSVGTRADVSLNDCLQRWEDTPGVGSIILGIEAHGNPRKFVRLARRITQRTPLIVVQPPSRDNDPAPGRHTRPIELSTRGLEQVLDSAGVVRVAGAEQALDLADALARTGMPSGTRVGIVANSPALADSLRTSAKAWGVENIVESRTVPLASDQNLLHRAVTSAVARGTVDLLVAGFLDPLDGNLTTLLESISTVARHSEVPLLLCIVTDQRRREGLMSAVRTRSELAPVYRSPDDVIRVASGMLTALHAKTRRYPQVGAIEVDRDGARRIIDSALTPIGDEDDQRRDATSRRPRVSRAFGAPTRPERERDGDQVLLSVEQTRALLAHYGIEVTRSRVVRTVEDAVIAAKELGYPVALKSSAQEHRHRLELGAARLDVTNDDHVRRAVQGIWNEVGSTEIPLLVQPMERAGIPVVMRTHEDPSFGPILTVGMAGDASTLLGDTASAIPPLDRHTAMALLQSPISAQRLQGARGVKEVDMVALADVAVRLGHLANDFPELRECVLHPVLASSEGARVVDARVTLAPAPFRMEGLRRVLGGSGGL